METFDTENNKSTKTTDLQPTGSNVSGENDLHSNESSSSMDGTSIDIAFQELCQMDILNDKNSVDVGEKVPFPASKSSSPVFKPRGLRLSRNPRLNMCSYGYQNQHQKQSRAKYASHCYLSIQPRPMSSLTSFSYSPYQPLQHLPPALFAKMNKNPCYKCNRISRMIEIAFESMYNPMELVVQRHSGPETKMIKTIHRKINQHVRCAGQIDHYEIIGAPLGCPLRNFAEAIKNENENVDIIHVTTHYTYNEVSMTSLFGAMVPLELVRKLSKNEYYTSPYVSARRPIRKNLNIKLNLDTIYWPDDENFHFFNLRLRNSRIYLENSNMQFPLPNQTITDTFRLSANRLFLALSTPRTPCMFLIHMVIKSIWEVFEDEPAPYYLLPSPKMCCENSKCYTCSSFVIEARRSHRY